MPWKEVNSSTKGMITSAASTIIAPEASPYISGCYLKNGEVISDFGYVKFPVPSGTKTNLLHGSVLAIPQFTKADSTSYLLALTTTNLYEYNTSTLTWDNKTRGTLVSDCQDAWDASANVTSTADTTIKLTGTKSAKHVIAAAFTTGIASTDVIADTDYSTATALHFWIYSTIATAAGQLQVGVSETITMGGTPLWFDVPALVANTWTPCCVDGTFTGYDHVISVGLNVVTDVGAAGATVYLDDIKAVTRFTGTESDRWSFGAMNDTFIFTNGKDAIQKYTGTGYCSALSTALSTGAITKSKVMMIFKDHVVFLNNEENGSTIPNRSSWGNIGKIEDYASGTSGYQDLTDSTLGIVGYTQIGEDEAIIYKEDSMVLMKWVGGQTPFRFETIGTGNGAVSKDSIITIGTNTFAVDEDTFTSISKGITGFSFELVPDIISSTFFSSLNVTYKNRLFTFYDQKDKELQIWTPTITDYPNRVYCINMDTKAWYIKNKSMTGFGVFAEASSKTIGDLVGTIGEQFGTIGDNSTRAGTKIILWGDTTGQIFKVDKGTHNDNGSAILSEYQTPDFSFPEIGSFRVTQLLIEARGQEIICEYSTDQGQSWNATQGAGSNVLTLDSIYDTYQQDFDTVCDTIRFRFRKASASKGFAFRYYGFYYLPRSGR